MHRQGVVHGDLYGTNIMLSKGPTAIKIIDFGACEFQDSLRYSGAQQMDLWQLTVHLQRFPLTSSQRTDLIKAVRPLIGDMEGISMAPMDPYCSTRTWIKWHPPANEASQLQVSELKGGSDLIRPVKTWDE